MNLKKLEEFMLTGKRLANYSFIENKNKTIDHCGKLASTNITNTTKEKEIAKDFLFPNETDSLFWCFYIMKNGYEAYEVLGKINVVLEKKIKIDYIELLRKNKQIIKTAKIAPLTHIESQLLNESRIDIKTFLILCVFEKLNVLYLHKKTYFLLDFNGTQLDENQESGTNTTPDEYSSMHVLKRMDEPLKYGVFENEISENITNYANTFYKIENLSKPIKAISSYKVNELLDIAKKFDINTVNNATKKQKTKQEIYECIVQQLC